MATISNKRTVAEGVRSIMTLFPETRNDDKVLMSTYWLLVDEIDTDNFIEEFHAKATPPESIRRARQLIQEAGFLLPTDFVVATRRSRQADMRNAVKVGQVV